MAHNVLMLILIILTLMQGHSGLAALSYLDTLSKQINKQSRLNLVSHDLDFENI